MDPFAGVGTTLVEANRLGLDSVGFEINPFAALVCRVKLGAVDVCLRELQESVKGYKGFMESSMAGNRIARRPPGSGAGFLSSRPQWSTRFY